MTSGARAGVALTAALAFAGVACGRDKRQIRAQFGAAFDAEPTLAIAPCPDAEAKLERLRPLFELAMRAYKSVEKFDDPLPRDLAADLAATPIAGSVSDYRCFLTDGTDRKLFVGTIANLFLRKGEALLAQGKPEDGWAHVVEGLSVYSSPRPFEFLMYFSAGTFVRRARALVDRFPPPPAVLDRLELMAASGLLPRPGLCAGLRLEFLSQTYLSFFETLAPLRPHIAARWGERADTAFAAMAENAKPGNLALWRAAADLYAPLVAGCLDPKGPPLATLEPAARAKLAAMPRDSLVARLAPTTLERLAQYGDLEDEFLMFFVDLGRRRLRIARLPIDAASIEKRLLVASLPVPLASAWDGSTVTVHDDPARPGTIVVARGKLRRALPALPPR